MGVGGFPFSPGHAEFKAGRIERAVGDNKGQKSAGPVDHWSITREGVTFGGAPLRDPWAPRGLPVAGPFCLADASCDVGIGGAIASIVGALILRVISFYFRILDIEPRLRKVRADECRSYRQRGPWTANHCVGAT